MMKNISYGIPTSQETRGLIDCDSFFASCERVLDPSLHGRPVCIGQDVIIARSYEAKSYGVNVGTPVREAKKVLPANTAYLAPRIHEYTKISSKLMEFLRKHCPRVEVFSIDEAFIDLTGMIPEQGERQYLVDLQVAIRTTLGIPVSIGLAKTRLISKMLSGVHKPFGICIGTNEDVLDSILAGLPVGTIPFIGPRTEEKIRYRCTSALAFKQLPYAYIQNTLGKNGLKLWFEINGHTAMTFDKKKQSKSITRTRSFNPHFTREKSVVWNYLQHNIQKALYRLIYLNLKTQYLRLHFRDKAFQRFGYHHYFPSPTSNGLLIIKTLKKLFDTHFNPYTWYRTTGMSFGELVDGTTTQPNLFDTIRSPYHDTSIDHIIQGLNQKYGKGMIQYGMSSSNVGYHNKDPAFSSRFIGL